MPITSPLVCPVTVGRDTELAFLAGMLAGARHGPSLLAAIIGEAGGGKSRLAGEIAAQAPAAGFRVVIGGCTERDLDFPFAPFVDALRQLLAQSPADAPQWLSGHEAPLAALLPELRGADSDHESAAVTSPEQAKRHRFEAIVALLLRLAANQPLLLVLEDLHWADQTSLELIELLPRRLAAVPVLIVITARSDEPDSGLGRSLAALRRGHLLAELTLEPLAEDDVARMLEAMLPVPLSPGVIATVYRRTNGNPFFVEELIAAAPVSAAWLTVEPAVPRTVGETVRRRLAALDEPARSVAELAAVVGQRVDLDILRSASDLDDETLDDAIDALIEGQWLRRVRGGGRASLVFRHALTRDAIHDALRSTQRRTLHAAVGRAIETQADRIPATAELGYHFHAAELWREALGYAREAGNAARRGHATVEALGHDRRALDAALALDDPAAAELHRRCGQSLGLLGAFGPALSHLTDARRLANARGDREVEQAVLFDLAGLYASRDYREAERFATEALACATALGDPQREARALNRLGNVVVNEMRFAEGRALHEQALARFETLGDQWGSADALDLIGMARYLSGEVPAARDAFARAAAVFDAIDDRERLASALTSRGLYLAVIDGPCRSDADPAAFRADAGRGLLLCQDLAWRPGEAYAHVALACSFLGDARYREALHEAERGLAIAGEIEHRQWHVIALLTIGLIHADALDDAGALDRFEDASALAREIGAAQWVERLDAWIAHCQARLGHLDAAGAAAAALIPTGSPATIGERRALGALAEIALIRGQPDRALSIAGRLLDESELQAPGTVLLRARALAALGRTTEADAALQTARHLAAIYGPRSILWRVAAARSRLWQDRDPDLSRREAGAARLDVAALASELPDGPISAAFLSSSEIRPWRPRQQTPSPGGLTPREREVAALIGRGLSNKEIARELFIAEKTVEMHVSHCLAKLDVASRAHLATWAVARGLAPSP